MKNRHSETKNVTKKFVTPVQPRLHQRIVLLIVGNDRIQIDSEESQQTSIVNATDATHSSSHTTPTAQIAPRCKGPSIDSRTTQRYSSLVTTVFFIAIVPNAQFQLDAIVSKSGRKRLITSFKRVSRLIR
jgi:hypothetical protein